MTLPARWLRCVPPALTLLMSLAAWRHLPSKQRALRAPLVLTALALLEDRLAAWPGATDRIDPTSGETARREAVRLASVGLTAAHLAQVAPALGLPLDLSRTRQVITGVVLVGLGNLLPKLPRNALVGIRTPWTLADPSVWERTHRVGGYLCAGAGLVSVAGALRPGRFAERVQTLAIASAVTASVVYSAVIYYRRPRWNS